MPHDHKSAKETNEELHEVERKLLLCTHAMNIAIKDYTRAMEIESPAKAYLRGAFGSHIKRMKEALSHIDETTLLAEHHCSCCPKGKTK